MLREYTEKFYLPCPEGFQQRTANNAELGRRIPEWFALLTSHWDELHWGQLEFKRRDGSPIVSVQLYLGDITAYAVEAYLYADAPDDGAPLCQTMIRSDSIPGAVNGHLYRAEIDTEGLLSDFTPRVIPYFPLARMPLELPLISWWSGQPVKEIS